MAALTTCFGAVQCGCGLHWCDKTETKLTRRTVCDSVEALQGAIASGAEQGAIASMERFAAYLGGLQSR